MERPRFRGLYQERPREWDFWICPRCGLEFDRRDEWQMEEALPNHLERHDNQTN